MPTVSIVQRILPHYRQPFFERLHDVLARQGVELELWYGQEEPGTRPGSVDLGAHWARRVHNRYLFPGNPRSPAVWQPCLRHLLGSDLVITEHAARLLINYPLAALARAGRTRFALWGHGTNLQSDGGRLAQRMRTGLTQRAHWWFAYTALSARLVARAGYPEERITVVNNAIDTSSLRAAIDAVPRWRLNVLRREFDLTAGATGLFCGRLVEEKRIDLLLAAAERIHAARPEFRLLVVGDGPLEGMVRSFSATHPWVHCAGPKFGTEAAPWFAIGDFLVMPGLVGLVIVDSFAAELPLITTNHGRHSPEIEYLQHDRNAIMAAADVESFAAATLALMGSVSRLEDLRAGCRASAAEYTLESMVARFGAGVTAALAA